MAVINRASNIVSSFIFGCALFVLGLGFIHDGPPVQCVITPYFSQTLAASSPREALQAAWRSDLPHSVSSPRDILASSSTLRMPKTSLPDTLIETKNITIAVDDAPVVEIISSSPQAETVARLADLRLLPDSFKGRLPFKAAEDFIDQAAARALSLTSLAQDKKFLEAAWVSYDAGKQLWKATWQKPPMFHFGMVLLPAILDHLQAGQAIKFEAQGKPMLVTKNDAGQLMLNQNGNVSALGSKMLRDLLEARVQSDGLSLYLDKNGNLVLQANGDRAQTMASLQK